MPPSYLAQAEADLAAGARQERKQEDACVDSYYRAAVQAWRAVERAVCPALVPDAYQAACDTYQRSLARLIPAASRFGRLDPRAHLVINDPVGRRAVPIVYYGCSWRPCDFSQLIPASEVGGRRLQSHYRERGLGLSLVATRRTPFAERFVHETEPFSVTAVLRPADRAESAGSAEPGDSAGESAMVLELYNPHVFDAVRLGPASVRLERDLSAPLEFAAEAAPRQYLRGFFDPGEADVQAKLFVLEPYQRGKIPVVFIHGLLSDPTTWLDAVNELRAYPDLYQRYQFWYYRYPTGGELLESVAELREQLLLARRTFDPACQDGAMQHMVLIGHSMGGLLARFQVAYSGDILWHYAARQPVESVVTTPAMRERLERYFFFDPLPVVSRVVFIGTPHRGATMARRLLGRCASNLVRPFGSEEPQYRQLMDQNRNVFHEYLWKSPPTSIDMLEPANPLVLALEQMPLRHGIRLHSIIGTGGSALCGEAGDGVVPVANARQAGVCSELFVPARHTELHRHPATIAELRRILIEHVQGLCPEPALVANGMP